MGEVAATPSRGRYEAWEAGRLAGVSGTTIGQWARWGYIRASVRDAVPHVYAFEDVAEAIVVHELLERGVAHQDVRGVVPALRERYGAWPLATAPLATVPGRRRPHIVVGEGPDRYEVRDRGWQQRILPADLEEVRRDLARGGWAARSLPDLEHVEVHPARLGGRPAIRGRRLAAQDVAEIADAAGGAAILRDEYGLTDAEVADARRWWAEVRRLERRGA